jgi:DNA-binding transcriptional LysR family regulator
MMSMVLNGLGICRCNDLIAKPLVRQGRLLPVLDGYVDAQRFPIYAMMLPQRHRLPKIRACIDYWAEWFGNI